MTPASLTAEDMAEASSYLSQTRDGLMDATAGLSSAQWAFKPAPDRWSVGEIVEHVVLVEIVVQGIVGNIGDAPAPSLDRVQSEVEDFIRVEVPKRATKLMAPAHLIPANQWSRAEALQHFRARRQRTIEMLSFPSLRGHVAPHPVFGAWDGYQWLLAAGAHGARHLEQIREVKAEPEFPETASAAAAPASH